MGVINRRRLRLVWERFFPERQIHYHSGGSVRVICLSKLAQIGLVLSLLLAGILVAVASVKFALTYSIIAAKEHRISEFESDSRDQSREMQETQERLLAANRALRARRDRVSDLVEQKSMLEDEVWALFRDLQSVTSQRDDAVESHRRITNRIRKIETQLTDLESTYGDLMVRLQEFTERNVADLETTIALTGLEANVLLEQRIEPPPGQGGPLIGLANLGQRPDRFRDLLDKLGSNLMALAAHIHRWAGLRSVLVSLPLAAPVESYYVSSRFGRRLDPITKDKAMHYGVDLSGAPKSPVRSTAGGIVIFAGHQGPYGKTVEIDHGHGIKTRYSHLHKTLVKKGQVVPFRHKIGLMGSTGRSTGSHVHYEIHFRGVPQDPAKFFKAGRYAFKVGPASDVIAARSGDIAADTASNGGSFRVHVASYRLPTLAEAGWYELRRGREDLFDGLKPTTERFDMGSNGGVFYRLLVGPMATLDAAQGLCTKLKRRIPHAWCNPVEVARN